MTPTDFRVHHALVVAAAVLAAASQPSAEACTGIFPTFASYAETTEENRARSLSPVDFSNWILTNFADVAELRAAIEADTVVVAPTIVPGWPAEPQPFHWVVYDAAGLQRFSTVSTQTVLDMRPAFEAWPAK